MADLLEIHKRLLAEKGFYREATTETVILAIEKLHNPDHIRDYFISEIQQRVHGGFLIKFEKRTHPLTDEELEHKYNRQ
jgi:hypothetical protein